MCPGPIHASREKKTLGGYTLLPFTFRRQPDGDVLVVNQGGEFHFVSRDNFEALLTDALDTGSEVFLDLKSKQFVCDGDIGLSVSMLATKLRTRKAFLRDFTTLHIVVLTACCNCRCDYCHASTVAPGQVALNMSEATAGSVVEMILRGPARRVKIEFQGGEPTINWPVLTYVVERAGNEASKVGKTVEFVLCTNLTQVTEDQLRYLRDHRVWISTSLDGPKNLHDVHRKSRNGTSTYDLFIRNLEAARSINGMEACSPLLTITRSNLHSLREVIEHYVRLGFPGVFLRTLNPYGFARAEWKRLAYPIEAFIEAYKEALAYVIELNVRGRFFAEYYTTLLLGRILTPFSTGFVDLQSPSGAGISGVVYDYDGTVYASDEGRMLARSGDTRFALGNVHGHAFEEIFGGRRVRELTYNSCVETLPGCAWCAYQLYCGADPVRYYTEHGDFVGHRPTSDFCKKNMAILDHLFSLIRSGDEEIQDVLWSWLTNRSYAEVKL
ncbi:MAG: His-Xaa-Ser system radical SAM maturase HxsB [Acidobacteriota bacterium]